MIKEIGSGVNDNRKKLNKLLALDEPLHIVVEHKDRLTRFGFNYIETLIESKGGAITVVNKSANDTQELVDDLLAIVYSFAARLYSKSRAKNIKEAVADAIS